MKTYELEVSRADLTQALRIVGRAIGKLPIDACFRFQNGRLTVEARHTAADAPARGTWPLPIFVGGTWVRRLARRMPAGDPIHLRVDAGRLYANRYSEPCAWTPSEMTQAFELPRINSAVMIKEAARILEPLHVKPSDLEELVSAARTRVASWSEEEREMTAIVAKAWALLAPLGVETSDLRRLVDHAVWNGRK